MSANNLSGQTIAGYELREILGIGGAATVYRALQPTIGRYVALKLLSAQLANNPEFAERLDREMRIIARFEHPHVIPTYDFGVYGEHIYIATRLMSGGTLRQRMTKGTLHFNDVKRILTQIASALDYAHHQGVIHQDIKPDNILLDDADNAYLSDFSMAKLTQPMHLTAAGAVVGTPAYMSPEQVQGTEVTAASDQYSLAVVVFQMLTGHVPFIGETPVEVLLKIVQQPPPPVSSLRADSPAALDPVLARAMAKKPEERYALVSEFAWDFGEALGEIAPVPKPISPPTRPTSIRIFVSYSKQNRTEVDALVKRLEVLGHDVWYDRELIPGHNWWEGILEQIRTNDLFVFALTPQALNSAPCKLEYTYAADLRKRVLPVILAGVSTHDLPPQLAVIQWVDFRSSDAEETLKKTFANLPPALPLPHPLPNPPAAPISPMSELKAQIESPTLTGDQQRLIVAKLEEFLNDPKDAATARELLQRMKQHRELIAAVEKKIDTLLVSSKRGFRLFPRGRD